MSFKEDINENLQPSEWTDVDESNFNKLDEDLWTYFIWNVKDPSGIKNVPDIHIHINGSIYDTLSKYYPNHNKNYDLRSVINEIYIKDVRIIIGSREKTKYTEYQEAETIDLERGKVIGGKGCEIFGVTKDGEKIHLKYEWIL